MRVQIKKYERFFFDKKIEKINIESKTTKNTLKYLIKTITPFNLNGVFLELGCGYGNLGGALSKKLGIKIVGLDISEKMIEKLNENKTKFYYGINGDIENKDNFKENSFDGLFCFSILHHFPTLDKVFENAAYWLKPGKFVFIFEPNGNNPINIMKKVIRRILQMFLGKNFLFKYEIGTPNEVDHKIGYYKRLSKLYNFKIIGIEYVNLSTKKTIKNMPYLLTDKYLPRPLKNSAFFIILKNND